MGRLILNTNTVTPLLKRMEAQGILSRSRSGKDERKVLVSLTDKGKEIRHEAANIPIKLAECLEAASMTSEELTEIRNRLNVLIDLLNKGRGVEKSF
jgi:MarR family transcriptional regulator, organic hydroperoxide resistance regulator